MSKTQEIADAIVARINAADLDEVSSVAKRWNLALDRRDLPSDGTLLVVVHPAGNGLSPTAPTTRNAIGVAHAFEIAIQGRLSEGTLEERDAEVEGHVLTAETIRDMFLAPLDRLDVDNVSYGGLEHAPLVDEESLQEHGAFFSLITVSYKENRERT